MNCENDDETESKMSIEDDNSKKKFIKIKELKNLQDMEKEDIRISNMIEINVWIWNLKGWGSNLNTYFHITTTDKVFEIEFYGLWV